MTSKKPGGSKPMRMDKIKKILDMMRDYDLSDFHLRFEDFELRASRGVNTPVIVNQSPGLVAAPPAAPPQAAAEQDNKPADDSVENTSDLVEITSPIVGTFYRKPDPESPPFVEVGDHVDPDTVICLVEAMKVFNEIKAEVSGDIVKVVVGDGTPVEFGQALFMLRPSV